MGAVVDGDVLGTWATPCFSSWVTGVEGGLPGPQCPACTPGSGVVAGVNALPEGLRAARLLGAGWLV